MGGSGLGLLRNEKEDKASQSFNELPVNLREIITYPRGLLLSKSSQIAPVHRDVYMDFLGIQQFNAQGEVVGEHRFIGLLTASAYHLMPEQIPLLCDKVNAVLVKAQLPKDGYAYKRLRVIVNQMPRDDLFQASVASLYQTAMGILHLHDRNQVKLFARVDDYQRFVSVLVYVPREKYHTALRLKMSEILLKAFAGTSLEFNTQFNEGNHVRVHFHVRTVAGEIRAFDLAEIEAELAAAARDWSDDFAQQAQAICGEREGGQLVSRFATRLPVGYRERFSAQAAVKDMQRLAALSVEGIGTYLYRAVGEVSNVLHLKLYGRDEPAVLSKVLPMLEDFGVSVRAVYPYEFHDMQGQRFWLQSYDLVGAQAVDIEAVRAQVEEGLQRIWSGEVESDGLNELVLTTTLDVEDVVILRALGKYMLQAGVPFSMAYIQNVLLNNREITQWLIRLFKARFAPDFKAEQSAEDEAVSAIESALASVKSLDEDRIFRWYLTLLLAMVRTNAFQRRADGGHKGYWSFKFAASKIEQLPKPRPMFEIFVYSPRVEGVHLRGGKIARGGLRWSERLEDFRTEVLGLVKAQMVKNSVIVPVGSKGGFVVKTPITSREAFLQEGKACYQTFIRGLLDITDNLVDGVVVAPKDTRRHDEDDPYLVVAADKGTASFSDLANAVAAEYEFWLGDAFASGGSAGYDHKEMGITARGAWESVKRHFRMMGKDIQNEPFTVIGIGDMGGDVFGNGMLLSRKIRLLAAFNHLHIFIDPNPDCEGSYEERARLFALPRSSWADYEKKLISEGGGVFSRQDKSIAITPEMQRVFDIEETQLTPSELIQKLLKAPVELIWNGGIGTYIKHSAQSHAQVGDRANDALRVDGVAVRAKVIGEGGNLGMTQLGRIEYALNGGRLYTDAIDNSAGVNSSDHEVNIKILLNKVVEQGDLTHKQRNELLESMTDEVAQLVLRQNYLQPQAIEMSAMRAEALLEHVHLLKFLEGAGRLERAIEYLPNEASIEARLQARQGLTNPELAVLLAYSKMWLYDELLDSDLPDEAYFIQELVRYFPKPLREKFAQAMLQHRLHREIICTHLTNDWVNRMGMTFALQAMEETGMPAATIARAYVVAREVFNANTYWNQLEALDNQVAADVQIELAVSIQQLLAQAVFWFLRNASPLEVASTIEAYAVQVEHLTAQDGFFARYFATTLQEAIVPLLDKGLSEAQARGFAALPLYGRVLEIVWIGNKTQMEVERVAPFYFQVLERLHGQWLLAQIQALPAKDYWERRAKMALLSNVDGLLRTVVVALLQEGSAQEHFSTWITTHQELLKQIDSLVVTLQARETLNLATLSVLLAEMATLGVVSR